MIVLVVINAPAGLRGHITRWLSETAPGVYVGQLSTRVRDRLWETVAGRIGDGYAVLIHPDRTEQRWSVATAGVPTGLEAVDFDGITAFRRKGHTGRWHRRDF